MKRNILMLVVWGVGGLVVWGAAPKKPKPELYVPMDYSYCGYRASERVVPDVKVAAFLEWQEGDCSPLIQQAIDAVSGLKADVNGYRGAVVLGEGVFRIDKPLRITASGVVLRGVGRDKTRIVKHGVDRGALIYVEGQWSKVEGQRSEDTLFIAADCIPAGTTVVPFPSSSLLLPSSFTPQKGERIDIVRPCTQEWIDHLGMGDFGGGLDYTGWKPTDIELRWDRTVTDVRGDTLFLDAPITTAITKEFGGAYIVRGRHEGEIMECGVEDLTLESAVNDWNPKDEDHCWDGISMNNVRDSWVRRVNFRHFSGSAVNLQRQTSRITVEDCIAQEPVSEIGGWRRQVFLTRGQQTLFQRCVSRQGIHDFAADYCAAGPNAFVQCEGEESLGFSGSIGSWAPGLLFDIVNIDGHDLRFANLEQFQFGTGWNTANSMFWQCTASTIECYSPDTLNRSSAHGCWGTLTGNGNWTSSNDHVQPRSLFYDQLEKRKPHPQPLQRGRGLQIPSSGEYIPLRQEDLLQPYILPRSTNATSSPTVEEAMELAQESLTEPRMTMEMWIDSISRLSSNPSMSWRGVYTPSAQNKTSDGKAESKSNYSPPYGEGLGGGSLYSIPWWSGRVKDNFCQKEARPAITRFVPGREGTGWTDRIDSVVSYLKNNGYGALDHHYGLWYDLRRTDHERVRRADGDVWAPFYEQPFARSGQGTAWDGLSRYDLTKPNEWYWSRLREFADKAAEEGIMLFNHHYFQHNILEAGAHWVDSPWRPVNNINNTPFPEPVPFAGDKRIFMAEQFYDETNTTLRPLHRQYIRMCLDQLKDQPNVVHLISAEYTGPLHFTRFWLETIAEWEQETGRHPLIALSCTRDVQDSLLNDPELNKVVDIIDIRYWHYNTEGLWAPEGGKNMAPRQWMRKMKVGKTGFDEAYRAVREMRDRYPDKAVTFFAQQYPNYGWAILMAGGSMANVPLYNKQETINNKLLGDIAKMRPMDGEGCVALGNSEVGYLVYTKASDVSLKIEEGKFAIYEVDALSGAITLKEKKKLLQGTFTLGGTSPNRVFWLRK
ncbi:MAG: pectate lyase [Prevotella sp.]|nr:pectate lyase [Prevotella sp.]